MNKFVKESNIVKIRTIMNNLKSRGMSSEYCETSQEACERALQFVREGNSVSWGGSATLEQIGLRDTLKNKAADGDIELIDGYSKKTPEEMNAEKARGLTADVFYMSTNAITMDGELVNIDGNGNRVAALCFGPKQVVVVAGINKITADTDSAVKRVKQDAAVPNALRFGKKTPCALTGKCGECLIEGQTICSMSVVTRFCLTGRIHVILVNENLGF